MNPKRPLKILLVAASFLTWSALGWLRLYAVVKIWGLLISSLSPLEPEYLVISAFCWGTVGLVFSLGLIFRRPFSRTAPFAAAGFALWYWIERFVLIRAESARANTLFAAGVSIMWVAFVFWAVRCAINNGNILGEASHQMTDQTGGP